jgi:hypothetical protein
LEHQEEPQVDHLETEDLSQLGVALELDERTWVCDRVIIAVLSHRLRAFEASTLNVEHWNGKIFKVHRSKRQNVSGTHQERSRFSALYQRRLQASSGGGVLAGDRGA